MRIPPSVPRYLLAAAVLLFGAWTLALTASLVLAHRTPFRAIAIYPTAGALGRAAETLVLRPTVQNSARASAYAQHALRRSPANFRAAAALAILAGKAGDSARAERLLRYSEAMSRRYVPTQLALLEAAVQKDQVAIALTHYDRAMRVSLESRMTLFPILVEASASPEILPEIAKFMAVPNAWKSSFLDRLIAEGNEPHALAVLVGAAKLDPRDEVGNRQLTTAIGKLVGYGAYPEAERLFQSTCTAACRTTPVNGNFESKAQIPPFGWELIGEGAAISSLGAGNHILEFVGWGGGPGARQLLSLRPGSYQFRMRSNKPSPETAITVTLACAEAPGRAAPILKTQGIAASGHQAFRVDVPAACRYQWLTLSQAPRLDRDREPAWIDDIAIAPIARANTDAAPAAGTTR